MLENVIETTENCRYCLMCRHVAPVGLVTRLETLTPHGIALTVASQRRGLLEWNDETVAVVYAEPDTGNCRAHCVTDQPLPEAIAAVRAELAAAGQAPAAVYRVHEQLQRWQTPFAEHAPPPATTATGPVALYVGDEAAYLWPGLADAAIALLQAVGIDAIPIGTGRSNGLVAASLGFPETARRQVEALLDELRATGAGRLLVLNPGDFFALRQMSAERLGLAFPENVELVEVTTVLADALSAGRLALAAATDDAPYAYVDPTHAVRVPTRHDAPRALAAAVLAGPAQELFWRRERAQPVGSSPLQFSRPEIAEKLTRTRLDDARRRGAELLVCDDAATLHHLDRYAGEYGLRVRGLYECLADLIT